MSNPKRTPTSEVKAAKIIRRCKRYQRYAEDRKPYSLNAIAYRHGIANSTVNKIAKGWKSSSLSDEICFLIKLEHEEGVKLGKLMDLDQTKIIAEDLNISHNTVRNIYAKYVRDNKPAKRPVINPFHRMYTQPLTASPGPAQPYY